MIQCKTCSSDRVVKNGRNNSLQRYKCKECGLNFVVGDRRRKSETALKKAFCVLMYATGKASFNKLAKWLNHSPSIIYRWISEAMKSTPEPEIADDIREMEFDEMWHFVGSKKTNIGSSRPWIVAQNELLPGLQVTVIFQPLGNYTTKSNI
jgi:transposase-like protein